MNGLKRLEGAKKVDLASFKRPTGNFVVTFEKAPKVGAADLKKVVRGFKLEKIGLRITAKVTKKGEAWLANGLRLTNPRKGKDLLAKVREYASAGKETLVVAGELVEDKKGSRSLTLSGVSAPGEKEKKSGEKK